MLQHLRSKTIAGLILMLSIVVGLALLGKLTPAVVDALKWIGTAFMGVRAVANYQPVVLPPQAAPQVPPTQGITT